MSYLSQNALTIAYLVNQYPKVSHSFIRREILGLEACGLKVARFSIRSCSSELVDESDKAELERTRVVLKAGAGELLSSLFQTILTSPVHFLKGLWQTIKIGRQSDRGILRHLAYLVEACVLLKWLREDNISHIHAHFGTNSATVAMLCHLMDGPSYSFTVHGPEEFDKVAAIALPQKVAQAKFVVAVSDFGRSQIYRWCPLSQWSKIHVVHCGVDSDFLRHDSVPVPTDPRLVCVGRLCPEKGQLLLVEAAGRLAQQGLSFNLTLVGDGPLRSELESRITKLGLHNHVEITGWASSTQVREAILSARALVLPSFAEGLPVVIMEALALNRPVISTYIAGIPELVEPSVCGWLVPSGSIDALVTAMKTAIEAEPTVLQQMGSNGHKRVTQQHNVVIEVGKLKGLFESALQPALTSTGESSFSNSFPTLSQIPIRQSPDYTSPDQGASC